jgi:predicted Zn-ribbon and HTH transcriptional regulator
MDPHTRIAELEEQLRKLKRRRCVECGFTFDAPARYCPKCAGELVTDERYEIENDTD